MREAALEANEEEAIGLAAAIFGFVTLMCCAQDEPLLRLKPVLEPRPPKPTPEHKTK